MISRERAIKYPSIKDSEWGVMIGVTVESFEAAITGESFNGYFITFSDGRIIHITDVSTDCSPILIGKDPVLIADESWPVRIRVPTEAGFASIKIDVETGLGEIYDDGPG